MKQLLNQSLAFRSSLSKEFHAYRVFNGTIEGHPGLVIDRYRDHWQIQLFKPQTKAVIKEVENWILGQGAQFIVLKERVSPSGASLHQPSMKILHGEDPETQIDEGEVSFKVDLMDTINPGLFLDMRHMRLLFYDWVNRNSTSEFKVLNLFSYTCSFGLHAAQAGASYSCNVDVSAKILDRGRRNYQISGLDDQSHGFVREDSREFLSFCQKKGKKFNAVVLDPPTFSRYKNKTWSVHKEMHHLMSQINEILIMGGRALISTNASDISNEDLKLWSRPFKWAVILEEGQAQDFPNQVNQKESSLAVVWFEKVG